MSAPFVQLLPNLSGYRDQLITEGAVWPLPRVPFVEQGLLHELPAPRGDRTGWPWTVETRMSVVSSVDWPTLTVVMPSYQQGRYLEEAIRSVLLQNYPRLEFVLFDGGSTDESGAIIERYRPWLSFARSQSDRGQSHAVNLGLSLATGNINGWLNSDDYYLPGAFQRIAAAWLNGATFIYGDSLELQQETGIRRHQVALYAHARYVKFPGLVASHTAFWASAQNQPLWEEQHCALDYELWIRLLPLLRLTHIPHPLAVARLHKESKSGSTAMKERWQEDAKRNGLAHPELYRSRPWLDREFRIVQDFAYLLRRRGEHARLTALQHECEWHDAITSSLR